MKALNENIIELKSKKGKAISVKIFEPQDADTCVVYIHGFAGEFDNLANSIKESVNIDNIAFAFPFFNCEGLDGAKNENYDYIVPDLEIVYKYIKRRYKRLIAIGHSLGCNKILLYIKTIKKCNIDKLILLAPQDLSEARNMLIHNGMMKESKINIENGQPKKILTGKFLGFAEISSKTFYQLANFNELHNTSYKHGDNINFVKDITIPTLVIIGQNDPGVENRDNKAPEDLMKELIKQNKNASYQIIPEAKHAFKNHLSELNEIIIKFIN